jgi:hypothetical protein
MIARPQVRELRAKRVRPCLNCGRKILTTADARLCGTCRLRAADLRGGLGEMRLLGILSERV